MPHLDPASSNAARERAPRALSKAELDALSTLSARAIQEGDEALAMTLLGLGADPNHSHSGRHAPLALAFLAGPACRPLFLAMMDAGADLDAPANNGMTLACLIVSERAAAQPRRSIERERSWRRLLDDLLELGADPNARSLLGLTPLMVACSHADQDSIDTLSRFGADPSLLDSEGRNCLHHRLGPLQSTWRALGAPAPQVVEASIARMLNGGADPLARDSDGVTPWDLANDKAGSAGRFLRQWTQIHAERRELGQAADLAALAPRALRM